MSNEAIQKHPQLPHVEWIDLNDNGVAVECIIIKRDPRSGDLYYIKTEDLDPIDRNRMTSILRKRDAGRYELWDLLSNTTLGNGENALEFFHQLVRVRTQSGVIMIPSPSRVGFTIAPDAMQPKRGPGRPRKDD